MPAKVIAITGLADFLKVLARWKEPIGIEGGAKKVIGQRKQHRNQNHQADK